MRSVLEQSLPPHELIVCDDGSTDDTAQRMERLAAEEPRVRYLRLAASAGGPGPARNLGIEAATGDWVAFLDDDDAWLPDKLRLQAAAIAAGDIDVVSGDALRRSGGRYFATGRDWRPSRTWLLNDNPLIVSTAVVRRDLLRAVGGFSTSRRLGAIADYDLWLRLSDRGARFLVLDAPLAVYDDGDDGRMSNREAAMQRSLARLMLARWARRPLSPERFRAAGNQLVRTTRHLRSTRGSGGAQSGDSAARAGEAEQR